MISGLYLEWIHVLNHIDFYYIFNNSFLNYQNYQNNNYLFNCVQMYFLKQQEDNPWTPSDSSVIYLYCCIQIGITQKQKQSYFNILIIRYKKTNLKHKIRSEFLMIYINKMLSTHLGNPSDGPKIWEVHKFAEALNSTLKMEAAIPQKPQ